MAESHLPPGFQTVTPYLIVEGAHQLIAFIETILDGQCLLRMEHSDGTIRYAAVEVGGSKIEISEASEASAVRTGALHVYVPDADEVYERAISAGAKALYPPEDMFYGERSAGVVDGSGNHWYIATFLEEVSEEELERRAAEQEKTAEKDEG